MAERILANQYVEFAEFPRKGKKQAAGAGPGRASAGGPGGRPLTDTESNSTWSQCFALYVAVLAPGRIADLMAYQAIIAKTSMKYRWPAWIVYNQNFRQEVAGTTQLWAMVDPSIYAVCFAGQAISTENWCTRCQSLDHNTGNCPSNSHKRQWGTAVAPPPDLPKIQ